MFVQYAADNVDHNLRTLDGRGTFRGMGMIATVSPGIKWNRSFTRESVSSLDLAIVGRVPILYHRNERGSMTTEAYPKLVNLKAENSLENLDILWKTSILFGSPRPAWSGMDAVHTSGQR